MHEAMTALILSHLPERVMKFLSWMGFDCDRERALGVIEQIGIEDTLFIGLGAKIGLGIYECVIVPVFGARSPKVDKIFDIVDSELAVYGTVCKCGEERTVK